MCWRILRAVLMAVAGAALFAVPASRAPASTAGPLARKAAQGPPVVMIVFDEFPVDTLRGPDGKIDSVRYPKGSPE